MTKFSNSSNSGRASSAQPGKSLTAGGASHGEITSPASSGFDIADKARAALISAASPADVDNRVASSLRASGIWIDKPASGATVWDEAEGANLPAAVATVEASLTPPTDRQVVQWLAALRSATKRRNDDDLTLDLMLEIYVPRLLALPADVVKHLCIKHRWGWFPAIAEMEDAGDTLAAPRRVSQMIVKARAAGREVYGFARREREPDAARPNEEQRQRVKDLIAGFASSVKD